MKVGIVNTVCFACAMGLVHQRNDKCVEKLIEIEENGSKEYENFEKKCPDGLKNVYDIDFCVKVCELEIGNECIENPEIGDDLCLIGSNCSQGRCREILIASNYDSQYDESDSEGFYNNEMFDELMNLLYA